MVGLLANKLFSLRQNSWIKHLFIS